MLWSWTPGLLIESVAVHVHTSMVLLANFPWTLRGESEMVFVFYPRSHPDWIFRPSPNLPLSFKLLPASLL